MQRLLGPDACLGEQLARPLGILGERVLGHPQAHPQRHQPGLGPVVEVPLDPPQLGLLLVDRSRAGRLERVDAPGQLALPGEASHNAAFHAPPAVAITSSGHTGQK